MMSETSPCIDGGSKAMLPTDTYDLDFDGDITERLPIDFLGEDRIGGLQVDVGAIEHHVPSCVGDLNADAIINVTDLLIVIGYWGSADATADINQDGIVDISDLLVLIGLWGPCD